MVSKDQVRKVAPGYTSASFPYPERSTSVPDCWYLDRSPAHRMAVRPNLSVETDSGQRPVSSLITRSVSLKERVLRKSMPPSIGSLFLGISRKAAAEFSFFLGIPVLMGAGLLDMYKMRNDLHSNDLAVLAVGIVVAFISALIVIRALIRYVSKHDFTAFAYYRIGFGVFILATWWTGWVHW